MIKLLVPGGSGQIGWELARRNGRDDFEILTCTNAELDVHDYKAVTNMVKKVTIPIHLWERLNIMNRISLFYHCRRCLDEEPHDQTPRQ